MDEKSIRKKNIELNLHLFACTAGLIDTSIFHSPTFKLQLELRRIWMKKIYEKLSSS